MSSSQPRRGLWDDEDGGGPSNAAPSQRPTFPQLDANWINLDTILTWLTICREEHNCAKYPKFGSLPTHLIDVRRDCLVSAAELPADARYCALSYVWGQVRTGKLTTATRQAFCQPGAFSPESPTPVVIPKTVRHALGLVRELGEQYLWVDSFCIVQDGDDFSRELRNMGGIYDRAHLTIVAATAWDADDGLRGLRGLTPRRQVAPNYGDDLDKFTSDPDCMIWTSRGWTYQEALFSRRMVMFCDQTIIWKCLCSSVNEVGKSLPVDLFDGHVGGTFHLVRGKNPWEQKTHTEALSKSPVAAIKTTPRVSFRKRVEQKLNKRFRSGSHKALDALDKTAASNKTAARNKTEWEKALESPGPIPPFKDLEHYFQGLVKHYNTRSFTDASDLPRAFEGIAQALTQNATPGSLFSQGLCWGLPVANLCQALTWCAGEPSLRPRNQALGFPSWSWMAWEGSINAQAVPQWLDILPSSQAYAAAMIAERDIKSPSSLVSSYDPRTSVRFTGEMCSIGLKEHRIWGLNAATASRGGQVRCYRAVDGKSGKGISLADHAVLLFPDQMEETDRVLVDLLGISICLVTYKDFNGDFEADTTSVALFVNALWVVRTGDALAPGGSAIPRYRRHGVAIVEIDAWRQECKKNGGTTATVLLE